MVARSSAEAKYGVMALGICEILWLKLLLKDFGIKHDHPMKLFCNNKVAHDIAHIWYSTIEQSMLKLTESSSKRNWSGRQLRYRQ